MAINGVEQEEIVTISSPSAVDFRQLFKILLRRRFLILGVAGIVMSAASVVAILAKPNYQSYMQLLVDPNLYKNTKSGNNQADGNSDLTDSNVDVVDYTAQLKLMLSNQLIQKAVVLLREDYPNITVEDIKGKKYQKSPLSVTRVEASNEVNRIPSQVFDIRYKDHDPIKTQRVLQTLLKVYRDYNIEQQKQRLTRGIAFVDERLPRVKNNVVVAERNLEAFRKKNNILDPEAQAKIILDNLAETQKQLQTTRAQLQDVQARYTAIQQKLAASPSSATISSRLSQSTRYQTLLNEIQKTELALAQEQIRYTNNSPVVQKLVEKRENQLALLRQEVTRANSDKTGNSEIDAAINQALNQSNQNESLLSEGQMAAVDVKLAEELVQIQTTALGLEASEKSLVNSEKRLQSELGKYPALIAQYNRLLREVQTNRKTLEQLMQAQQSLSLKIAQGSFDWKMMEAPERGVYTGSGRLFILGGGLIAAPIIGIIAALSLELLNDSIYTTHELQRITKLRLLGIVPKLQHSKNKRISLSSLRNTKALVADSQEIAPLPSHETLDIAYQNIQILNPPLPYKSLMVTSASLSEGKSTVALGLAVSSARTHHRVLIIDANLRQPSLHKSLDLPNEWGLSLLLVDDINPPFKNYIQPIHPSIDVLTAGPLLEDTVKLLSSRRMKQLLTEFEQSYDLILVDAPPILGTVDARILATLCNAIVLVARLGQITRAEIAQTTEILENLNLIGIIANQIQTY